MPRFTVLASGFGWHVQDLQRAAAKTGVHLSAALFQNLSLSLVDQLSTAPASIFADGQNLSGNDAVLVRMMPPAGLERVVFRMDILHRLHESGTPVHNPPRTVEMAVDKALSLARLAAAGIPVPDTWIGESPHAALAAFDSLGGDVVCKPIFGSEGRGLVRITEKEIAWRVAHSLLQNGSVIYFQRFIQCDNHDTRIMTLNGEPLAAMLRTAPPHDWRANVAQGATAKPMPTIPLDIAELAARTASVIGGSLIGIDIIRATNGQLFVLEVNAVPGWKALASVTGIDIPAEWLLSIKKTIS